MLNPVQSQEMKSRVSRAHLMRGEGSYWEMCRRDDQDQGMYGPLTMPFALPVEMLSQEISAEVWCKWYSSMKIARHAGAQAGRRQTPEELALAGNLRNLDPMLRLTMRLDLDLAQLACVPAGEFIVEDGPMSLINGAIDAYLGVDSSSHIFETVTATDRQTLAKMIEDHFPVMERIHKAGVLIRGISQHLLALGFMTQKMKSQHMSTADKRVVRLLAACLLRTIPSRIAILLCVTIPELSDVFARPCVFYGVSANDLATGEDIWNRLPAEALESTVIGLSEVHFPTYLDEYMEEVSLFDTLIPQIDTEVYHASCGRGDGKKIDDLYQAFVGEYALADQAEMDALVRVGGEFFAVKVPAVPEGMVRPDLCLNIPGKEKEAALALFNIAAACYARISNSSDLRVLHEYRQMIEDTGKLVKELSESNSPKRMSKIEKAGQQAMRDLERGKEWFISNLDGISDLIGAWGRFNSTIDKLKE